MRLTHKTEYTILALLHLARAGHGVFCKAEEIAEQQKIPVSFLQQILRELKQNRYIKTERGRAGGYALTREPNGISLAEICRLIDGPLAPTPAVSEHFYAPAPIQKEIKVMGVLKEIRDSISAKLEGVTLDML